MAGRGTMGKERVTAFSDGVIAIIITIMVLEFKTPESGSLAALRPLVPVFLGYVLSFVYVAIYWNNHHHLFAAAEKVNGAVLWANAHLLFWLSLFPFMTAWLGEHPNTPAPAAVYAGVLLLAAVAYGLLLKTLLDAQGPNSVLAKAVANDVKGRLSPVLYAVAIPLAYVHPWLADALFVAVALIWLVPDPRIERTLSAQKRDSPRRRGKKRSTGNQPDRRPAVKPAP
jgi:uncharacterized membrane protein